MTDASNPTGTAFQQGPDLLFDKSVPGASAVSLPPLDVPAVDRRQALGSALAEATPPLPEIGELELVRHYTRLAHRCFSIDENFYPLGSCTMKYNPRINERAAALPGLGELHPYQDDADVQGMLELLYRLRLDLADIAGLAEVCLQPAAGAHGEMTGLMVIDAYHRDRGRRRTKVLAPDSAHGTNPASCTLCRMSHTKIPSRGNGCLDLDALRAAVDDDTAALMLTYPNTIG
ncbi:MAG: aminomethyl-transferring glycine dehydrogenase subunit GcvPB, partial [Phycisphaerae bacterium]